MLIIENSLEIVQKQTLWVFCMYIAIARIEYGEELGEGLSCYGIVNRLDRVEALQGLYPGSYFQAEKMLHSFCWGDGSLSAWLVCDDMAVKVGFAVIVA